MTFRTSKRSNGGGDSYLALIKRLPLRPIRDEAQYDRAAALLFELSERGETRQLDAGTRDYIEVLGGLLETYDRAQGHLDTSGIPPVDAVKLLMAQHDMGVADLGRIVGSRGVASQILSGQRQMSKAVIVRLARHFHVTTDLFLGASVAA